MIQQEIAERNRQIALMLGIKLHESQLPMPHSHYTCYHSDWSWLMEAVEFVENNKLSLDNNRPFNLTIGEKYCGIFFNRWNDKGEDFRGQKQIISITANSKKEAVFIAVSDFAKLYNTKK